MSNKYVKEAAENNNKHLPKTFDEFSLMHPADASRVPMAHIAKLRKEFNEKAKENLGGFADKEIKWD